MALSQETSSQPDLKVLREAIPSKCFQPSLLRSFYYLGKDIIAMLLLVVLALQIGEIHNPSLRLFLWSLYGFLQGLVFTGIWVLAHECGHDAFSTSRRTNAIVGYSLHSMLLVPFYSWKFSHARHHRFANHMEKDTVFVPNRKNESLTSAILSGSWLEHAEDTPLMNLALLIIHQLFGWPAYILFNAGAGSKSLARSDRAKSTRQNHLDPNADVFSIRESPYVLLSDLGILTTFSVLYLFSCRIGGWQVFLLYGIPYLWMNNWLVSITYLHHTHPQATRYEAEAWTFQKGASSTVDRDFGFIGRHFFHGIIEYHVVHHLFSRIPFYHAEEATQAIMPLLGHAYIRDESNFMYSLWQTFTTCSYVKDHPKDKGHMIWN